jgi:hypothetical protein
MDAKGEASKFVVDIHVTGVEWVSTHRSLNGMKFHSGPSLDPLGLFHFGV